MTDGDPKLMTTPELKRMLKTYRELVPKDLYTDSCRKIVAMLEAELKARGVKSDKQTAL